jgi:hypothetical protein
LGCSHGWVFEIEYGWELHQKVSSFILVVYPPEHPNKADGMFRWVHHEVKAL